MERIHIYKQGNPAHPVLLLLHGMGGNERDLVDMGKFIDADASILSLRGEVIEGSGFRHFRRISPGVYDEEDLKKRTSDLEQFLEWTSAKYGFEKNNVISLGYSNGANLTVSHMFRFPRSLKGAILLHPLSGGAVETIPDLLHVSVFIGAGANDPICPLDMTARLKSQFDRSGANLQLSWFQAGHSLSQEELQAAKSWYQRHFL